MDGPKVNGRFCARSNQGPAPTKEKQVNNRYSSLIKIVRDEKI